MIDATLKFMVIRCLVYRGQSLSEAMNSKMVENAGSFEYRDRAEAWCKRLQTQEVERFKEEGGNQFHFWVEEIKND